jgi:mono/diheme cytochrome c family protein
VKKFFTWPMSLALILALLACMGAAAFFLTTSSNVRDFLKPSDTTLVNTGRNVYEMACANCHGSKLQGQPNWRVRDAAGYLPAPPHDPSGHTWHHPSKQLFNMVKFGLQHYAGPDYKTNMPKFERSLSDEQIIAVLSFIKSTWPEEIRAKHDEINRKAID